MRLNARFSVDVKAEACAARDMQNAEEERTRMQKLSRIKEHIRIVQELIGPSSTSAAADRALIY